MQNERVGTYFFFFFWNIWDIWKRQSSCFQIMQTWKYKTSIISMNWIEIFIKSYSLVHKKKKGFFVCIGKWLPAQEAKLRRLWRLISPSVIWTNFFSLGLNSPWNQLLENKSSVKRLLRNVFLIYNYLRGNETLEGQRSFDNY